MIEFTVHGIPVPQGSKKVFGKAVVETNEARLRPWRQEVAAAAAEAMAGREPLHEPVIVIFNFCLPRPKGHYGTGRNAGTLKPSAPEFSASKPDLDKLVRAVLDALTGVAFRDDAQVAHLHAEKTYDGEGRKPGVRVKVALL